MKKQLLGFHVFIWLLAFVVFGHAESLRLIGRGTIPLDLAVGETKVGGLSGISYDSASKTFWAVSDDSSRKGGPPRIYQLTIRLSGEADLHPTIRRVVTLRDDKGDPFSVADCEGIACTGRGTAWVTSEGRAGVKGVLPWVQLFSLKSGRSLRNLPVPPVYLPANVEGQPVPVGHPSQVSGILSNKSLESCALSLNRRIVYTANETSLLQEKAFGEMSGGAGLGNSTQVRISALSTRSGQCLGQRLYVSDAGCLFGSISDIAALDASGHLLVLERRVIRLAEGTGSCGIRVYRVDFRQPDATELRGTASVIGKKIIPLQKTLVYDSRSANISDLDNVEGLTLFPLPGGRRGLLAVSDNNFKGIQQTQLLLYEYLSP